VVLVTVAVVTALLEETELLDTLDELGAYEGGMLPPALALDEEAGDEAEEEALLEGTALEEALLEEALLDGTLLEATLLEEALLDEALEEALLEEAIELDEALLEEALELELATLLVEVPIVTVDDQVCVMVEMTELVLGEPLPEPLAPMLLVGGRTPLETGVEAATAVVVIDVSVRGQMVVDRGMIEVKIEAEPESGQLVTEDAQLRTVTSLVA